MKAIVYIKTVAKLWNRNKPTQTARENRPLFQWGQESLQSQGWGQLHWVAEELDTDWSSGAYSHVLTLNVLKTVTFWHIELFYFKVSPKNIDFISYSIRFSKWTDFCLFVCFFLKMPNVFANTEIFKTRIREIFVKLFVRFQDWWLAVQEDFA